MSDRPPVIVTERLTKFYGRNRGIEEVTIAVNRGKVFGIALIAFDRRDVRTG